MAGAGSALCLIVLASSKREQNSQAQRFKQRILAKSLNMAVLPFEKSIYCVILAHAEN
jgi:hypothetical protein